MSNKIFDSIEDAIIDLKAGKVIIVCDDEDRENEGDFIGLADYATPKMINFMVTHGRGLVCMPITKQLANKLDLNPMVNKNTDNMNTAFTISVDHISNTTGISAYDRATTVSQIINPNTIVSDLRRPGHIFPLVAKDEGVLVRFGHTEACVDLARLSGGTEAGVICEIMNEDGTMARVPDLIKIKEQFNLKMITIKDLIDYRKKNDILVKREAVAKLPTTIGEFNMIGYSNRIDDKEHVVVIKGNIEDLQKQDAPIVRIHSECLTGDVFHSLRCDCGEQLNNALTKLEEEGVGMVIYLRQEGRGIGLINKLKAYELQEQGYDTVEANNKLGFGDDLREYFLASQILRDLEIKQIRLITNNPEKIEKLKSYGINVVDRVVLTSTKQEHNAKYIDTKVKKFGHLF